MNYKKIVLVVGFLAVFGFLFCFNIPTAAAVTVEELQVQIQSLLAQIAILQQQIAEIQGTSCHTAPLWDGNYCSVSCKCNIGEGDCDSNYECNTGYCAYDVGAKYGQYPTIDVCEEKAVTKSITLLSPNGGEIWAEEEAYDITWKSSGVDKVMIEIAKGSQTWHLAYDASASLGKYSWTVKGVGNGSDYKINIWDSANAKIIDSSDNYFSIVAASTAPSITLIFPNGGEKWAFTNPYNITWKARNVDKVDIYLEKWAGDNGQIYAGGPLTQTIDENISASTGFYSWPLGHLQGGTIASAGSYYKIRIVKTGDTSSYSQQIADSSDNYFSIVAPTTTTKPDLIVQDVKYRNLPRTSTDIYAYFDITIKNIGKASALLPGSGKKEGDEFTVEVYKNSISSGNKIAAVMRGTSIILATNETSTFTNVTTYQDANLSDVASIIVKADTADKVDESDETNNTLTKTIAANIASITLLSPNGGEKWEIGKIYDITWTMSGISGTSPIDIFAVNEESSTFEPISKCTNLSSGESVSSSGYGYKTIFCGTVNFFGGTYKYSLTVPSSWGQGSKYKINIVIPGAQDSSDNYFSIVPATATPITSFNYTETDSYSGSVKFSWTSIGVDNVSFQVSCHQGLGITYAATGETFLCGGNDRRLSPDSFMYLKFDNISGYPINAQASLTPFIGGIGDGTKGKTINFTISVSTATSSITVLSPNGGERWAIGNTYEVTWKSLGFDKVHIDVTSGSSAYTLVSGIPASTGKYSWTIGANWPYLFTGDNYKIRVFTYPLPPSGGWKEGGNYDQSNNYFSIVSAIPGSLSVSLDASSPASTNLNPGQTNITFAKIKLTASVNNDVNNMNAIQIGSDSVNASNYLSNIKVYDGTIQLGTTAINLTYNGNYYYQWIYVSGVSIPAATSKILTIVGDIKSTASNGFTRLGIAGLNFTSPGAAVLGTPVYGYNMAIAVLANPSITLISPNGGETWQVNYMYQIRWKSSNLPADAQNRISIGLVKKGAYEANPSQYLISLLGSTANDGSENINIPSSISPGEYKVEVAYCPSIGGECTVKDSSDNYFNIISTPVCDDPDGRDYYTIGICKDNYGSYTDSCHDDSVKEYYCDTSKLCDSEWVSCPYGCDSGICKTGIKVLYPNGGEQLTFGNTYDITWDSGGIDKVNIELITPTGGLGLASNILASAGKFNWKVDTIGSTSDSYKIKISNSAQTSISDSSDNYFSIVSEGLGLKNLENLLADISKAVSKLLEEIK